MGVPTSEVGYTSAMPRREDHEVRKGHVGALGEKNIDVGSCVLNDTFLVSQKTPLLIFYVDRKQKNMYSCELGKSVNLGLPN